MCCDSFATAVSELVETEKTVVFCASTRGAHFLPSDGQLCCTFCQEPQCGNLWCFYFSRHYFSERRNHSGHYFVRHRFSTNADQSGNSRRRGDRKVHSAYVFVRMRISTFDLSQPELRMLLWISRCFSFT